MDSSDAPPRPVEGGADAPPDQGHDAPPAAEQGEDIQITGVEDVDAETAAQLAAADAAKVPATAAELAASDTETAPAPEIVTAPDAEAALEPAPPADATPPSMVFLSVLTFVVAAADIASKEWAKHALAGPGLKRVGKNIVVIPDHLDFIFAQNPGGAWSFLRGVPDGLRRPFFLFVSSAAIVFIVMVYRRLEPRQWAMRWGLPLALGGAIGNLADRVRYGWVVDFIDVYWKGKANEMHWPTFNVADIAIVLGVGLMALDLLSLRKMPDPAPPERTPEAAGGAA